MGGGQGGGTPTCVPACAGWQACVGTACVSRVASLAWVTPADMATVGPMRAVPLEVVARDDAGVAVTGAPLSWVSSSGEAGAFDGGTSLLMMSPASGSFTLTASVSGSAPMSTVTVNVDSTGPLLVVTATAPPNNP